MKINGILKKIDLNLRNFFRKKLKGKKTFVKIIDINLRNFFRKKLKGKKTFVKIICKI